MSNISPAAANSSSVLLGWPPKTRWSHGLLCPLHPGSQEGRHCVGRNEAFHPMLQTAPKWLALTAISVPPQAESTAQRLPCCPQRLCPKPVRERMSRVRKHSVAGSTSVGDLSRTKFFPVHRKHQRLTPFQPLQQQPEWVAVQNSSVLCLHDDKSRQGPQRCLEYRSEGWHFLP